MQFSVLDFGLVHSGSRPFIYTACFRFQQIGGIKLELIGDIIRLNLPCDPIMHDASLIPRPLPDFTSQLWRRVACRRDYIAQCFCARVIPFMVVTVVITYRFVSMYSFTVMFDCTKI